MSEFRSLSQDLTLRQHIQTLYHLSFVVDINLLFPLPSSHPLRLQNGRWEITIQEVMVKRK